MSERSGLGATVLHYAQGLLMGGADIIPGVSGGTMALIVGIYERLIHSVRSLAGAAVYGVRGRRAEARERLAEVDWRLVLPLGAGILTALVIGARVIPGLLERYPEQMRSLFFGLIAGSLAIPWNRMGEHKPREVAVAVLAAVAAFWLVGLPPREIADPALPVVFGAAAIAICAMILPGVSGSFLLFVMGLYAPTLQALNSMDLAYVAVFAGGAVVGLGLFSRLLDYLLRHHHDLTMAALVGLMAGSLRALWPFQDADRGLLAPPQDGRALTALVIGLIGFGLIVALGRLGSSALRRHEPGT